MSIVYLGLSEINGPLVVIEGVQGVSYEEIVTLSYGDGNKKMGQVIKIEGDKAVIQVFEGSTGLSMTNTKSEFTGHSLTVPLSKEILGRIFDGVGRPIDYLEPISSPLKRDINGGPLNPIARTYPRDFIQTGISSIDTLTTLICGQKLPIFSGNGLPHDKLAAQIVRQAQHRGSNSTDFAIVFAAMGVKNDVADFFRYSFEQSGVLSRVVMFLNLSDEPVIERIITPRVALTVAEYLAFDLGMDILVVLTDMTSYAEALREISSSKNEIPSRKGYPGYLYSDLASLYERAGIVKGKKGSVTQIPILSMPNDDITHPVPDLTGYITEGQIVVNRGLHQAGIYPPIAILPSLSRLMKDGIGEGYTREDHPSLANQLFASYAKVVDVRALASVIGEEDLGDNEKKYIVFGREFEKTFLNQGYEENRKVEKSLDNGWELLRLLPRTDLDRIDGKMLDKYLGSSDFN